MKTSKSKEDGSSLVEKLYELGFIKTYDHNIIDLTKTFKAHRVIKWLIDRVERGNISESQKLKIFKGLEGYLKDRYDIQWKQNYPTFTMLTSKTKKS